MLHAQPRGPKVVAKMTCTAFVNARSDRDTWKPVPNQRKSSTPTLNRAWPRFGDLVVEAEKFAACSTKLFVSRKKAACRRASPAPDCFGRPGPRRPIQGRPFPRELRARAPHPTAPTKASPLSNSCRAGGGVYYYLRQWPCRCPPEHIVFISRKHTS